MNFMEGLTNPNWLVFAASWLGRPLPPVEAELGPLLGAQVEALESQYRGEFPENVRGILARAEWTWAAETRRYVRYGAPIYEDARSGKTSSPMLEEWYRKYGAELCRQASERLGIFP